MKVAMTKFLGKMGEKTSQMAEDNNAVAAINGGSFIDKSTDGTAYAGTGSEPGGFVISGGSVIYPKSGADEKKVENVIAFTKSGELVVGDHSLADLKKMNVQEAMCFRRPNIVINGIRQVKNKMEDGLNPRTAVGQKQDGTIILLVIDGRKITSPGASLYDVQEIMMERGAVNAGALDGGYSSTMYYKGNVINSPNAWDGERTVATAFYVEQ
ncbi:exopolysaccharide biosynthesis protein [Clostridium beijerinckii]|nr:exopolysaccharide biosynthesis protein [Clostridium beijerinckii]